MGKECKCEGQSQLQMARMLTIHEEWVSFETLKLIPGRKEGNRPIRKKYGGNEMRKSPIRKEHVQTMKLPTFINP